MGKSKKLFGLLALLFSFLGFAQPPCPTCTPGNGGVGGTTPGAQSVPVDMYIFILGIAAILLIAYFARKYSTQKI